MATDRRGRRWSRDELIIVFNLYCRLPFGQLHRGNPDIIKVAGLIDRTPDALAMKLVNIASLDPVQQKRGVRGLKNVSSLDREMWQEFHKNWESMAIKSEEAVDRLAGDATSHVSELRGDMRETETTATTRIRLVQRFFRNTVISAYDSKCAICQIAEAEFLNASHIVPWSVDQSLRANPTNGISLCALHDRAFDRGFISLSDSMTLLISDSLRNIEPPDVIDSGFLKYDAKPIAIPSRFAPNRDAVKYHRESIFRG